MNDTRLLLLLPLVMVLLGGGCGAELPEAVDDVKPADRYERPAANSPGTLRVLGPH